MKVLIPNTTPQIINVIPREYVAEVDVSVYNKNTGETLDFNGIQVSNQNGYSTFSIELQPKNQHHFVITMTKDGKQIHKFNAYAKE